MKQGINFPDHVKQLEAAFRDGTLPTEHDIRYLTVLRNTPDAHAAQGHFLRQLRETAR